MKIYLAAMHPVELMELNNRILLSFYDLHISPLPFRKETFNFILNENKNIRRIT